MIGINKAIKVKFWKEQLEEETKRYGENWESPMGAIGEH